MAGNMTRRTAGQPAPGAAASRLKTNLGKQAVKLALNGDWERAAEVNRAVLELNPRDCEAANRLAKALMELSDYDAARQILEELCQRAPGNNIARKNLARLQKLQSCGGRAYPSGAREAESPRWFIEESGKSCTTTLRQPADPANVASVSAGDAVTLAVQDDNIVVSSRDGRYLGVIEPRLGRRLRRLIASGNRYAAAVVASGENGLSVIVRETAQHPALRHIISFPGAARGHGSAEPGTSGERAAREAYAEEPEVNPEEAPDTADDGEPGDSEAVSLTDEVDDDADGDADVSVPILDTDVDSVAWPAFVPAAESDWE